VALTPGTYELGPGDGSVTVKTYREGVAAKVGHDLVIDVGRWEATVEIGPDGAISAVSLDADAGSLSIREGHRGVKPLTDKDRRDIVQTIDSKILRRQPIACRSTAVRPAGDGVEVEGSLTIAGETRPVTARLQAGPDGRLTGTIPVVQSQWGIKPYRGLMGALKVRDDVEIVVDASLPAA
jgi:polyisoprenoid-binding protein YceI